LTCRGRGRGRGKAHEEKVMNESERVWGEQRERPGRGGRERGPAGVREITIKSQAAVRSCEPHHHLHVSDHQSVRMSELGPLQPAS
jgi:hypothetical protein